MFSAGFGPSNHLFSMSIQKIFAPASISSGLNFGLQNGDAEMNGSSPGRAVNDPFGESMADAQSADMGAAGYLIRG